MLEAYDFSQGERGKYARPKELSLSHKELQEKLRRKLQGTKSAKDEADSCRYIAEIIAPIVCDFWVPFFDYA